jgi:hypothetical protein
MPDDLLYITIDDAIARVIDTFGVTLNRLVQLELASERDLTGFERTELRDLVDARRADIEAGRPEDGALRRARTQNLVAAGAPKAEAQRRAAREEADLVRDEERRLRARPDGWVRPTLSSPRLQRGLVEGALGEMIDNLWQQGQTPIMHMAADRSAVLPVPRATSLQLRRDLLTGEWVIVSRDRIHDPQAHVGLHITEAGLKALLDAVETKLALPPWFVPCTLEELVEIQKDADITVDRWATISRRYEIRLQSRTKPPMLDRRGKDGVPFGEYDREWARSRSGGIDITDREITALRLAYLPKCRERRERGKARP